MTPKESGRHIALPRESGLAHRSRRKRLFDHLHGQTRAGRFVNLALATLILANVIFIWVESHEIYPLGKQGDARFEIISSIIFAMEYLARLWVSPEDIRFQKRFARLRYALTPLAITDLLATLPGLLPMVDETFLPLRLLRVLRMLRILKLGRYSKAMRRFGDVIRERGPDLFAVTLTVLALLFIGASMVYFAEHDAQPDKFGSITDALWWGMSALSTVGYGDVYPITPVGKVIGSIVSLLGVGLFAMPAGIIASGYMEKIKPDH